MKRKHRGKGPQGKIVEHRKNKKSIEKKPWERGYVGSLGLKKNLWGVLGGGVSKIKRGKKGTRKKKERIQGGEKPGWGGTRKKEASFGGKV